LGNEAGTRTPKPCVPSESQGDDEEDSNRERSPSISVGGPDSRAEPNGIWQDNCWRGHWIDFSQLWRLDNGAPSGGSKAWRRSSILFNGCFASSLGPTSVHPGLTAKVRIRGAQPSTSDCNVHAPSRSNILGMARTTTRIGRRSTKSFERFIRLVKEYSRTLLDNDETPSFDYRTESL